MSKKKRLATIESNLIDLSADLKAHYDRTLALVGRLEESMRQTNEQLQVMTKTLKYLAECADNQGRNFAAPVQPASGIPSTVVDRAGLKIPASAMIPRNAPPPKEDGSD